jgi:hypothetical protein
MWEHMFVKPQGSTRICGTFVYRAARIAERDAAKLTGKATWIAFLAEHPELAEEG